DLGLDVAGRGDDRRSAGELAAGVDDAGVEVRHDPAYAVRARLAVEDRVELGVLLAQPDRGRRDAGDLLALDQPLHPPVGVVLVGQVERLPRAGKVVELAATHRLLHLQVDPPGLVADPFGRGVAAGALVALVLDPGAVDPVAHVLTPGEVLVAVRPGYVPYSWSANACLGTTSRETAATRAVTAQTVHTVRYPLSGACPVAAPSSSEPVVARAMANTLDAMAPPM